LVWSETYSTLNNERIVAGAVDDAGNFYVVGRAFGTGFYDLVIQCYHGETGTNQWSQTIASAAILDDVGWDIAIDGQGRPVVCGLLGTSPADASVVTSVRDPVFGEEVWSVELPGAIYNIETVGGWVAVADNDDVIMGTRTWSTETGYDVVLRRYAAADGQEVWSQRWNSGGNTADDARAMHLAADGDVLVAGVSGGDYLVARFAGDSGQYRWHGSYAGPPDWYDVATCLDEAPDGTVVASGFSDGSGTGWDVATVGFDPTDGAALWNLRFDGYGQSDEARGVAVGPAGDVAVVGYCYSYDHGNDALIAFYEADAATAAPDLALPPAATLADAYPNPFNPSVTLAYALPRAGAASLTVYDARGREVVRLADGHHAAGRHTVRWQGVDRAGRSLPSGVYLAVLRAADTTTSQKLLLAK
jgi:hypothetical protein